MVSFHDVCECDRFHIYTYCACFCVFCLSSSHCSVVAGKLNVVHENHYSLTHTFSLNFFLFTQDVIYHNEAYANSSDESSPECERVADKTVAGRDDSLSPQRNQSFIAAVINAIKSAANTAKQSVHKKSIGEHTPTFGDDLESDSTEMLDSETEPCLMMENVLEDVSMPDSHSHNMVSSTNSQLMVTGPTNDMNKDEESLHNLCEAIANRKKIEQQANLMMMQHRGIDCEPSNSDDVISDGRESIADIPSISENWTVQHLVDHVINVDNLVTKLLKVLRLIQIENDNCVQRLISEK